MAQSYNMNKINLRQKIFMDKKELGQESVQDSLVLDLNEFHHQKMDDVSELIKFSDKDPTLYNPFKTDTKNEQLINCVKQILKENIDQQQNKLNEQKQYYDQQMMLKHQNEQLIKQIKVRIICKTRQLRKEQRVNKVFIIIHFSNISNKYMIIPISIKHLAYDSKSCHYLLICLMIPDTRLCSEYNRITYLIMNQQ